VTTRGAFPRQGLFVGSGGLYSPGPATTSCPRLAASETTAGRRSHVILSLGRFFTDSPKGADEARHTSGPFTDDVTDTFVPAAPPPRPPFTRTATLFGALRTSLFGARTLPADFCNYHDVRTPTGALVSSRGRRP
jgi:hypothetical protein